MMGFVLIWGWVALQVRSFDQIMAIMLPPWIDIAGWVLMIAGGILGFLCVAIFVVRGKGTAAPFDAPRVFVAVGPYRYVRNPMYIGGLAMLVGFGMFNRSISMVMFSAIWLLTAHCFVIFYEERILEQRFGASYVAYKSTTNRWLPKPL